MAKKILSKNIVYYTPYQLLDANNVSFADFVKNKPFYHELAVFFEKLSSREAYTEKEADFIAKIIKRYSPRSKYILDVACGTGRHDRILSKKDFLVTGVDASKDLIGIAKKYDRKTKYVLGDMRNFKMQTKFDCALFIWDAYVYLSRQKDMTTFLERIYAHLVKGGILILDAQNFWRRNRPDTLACKNFVKDGWNVSRIAKRTTILKDKVHESIFVIIMVNLQKKLHHIIVEQELVRVWSLKEIRKFFDRKFKIVKLFGNFDVRANYNKIKSPRLIIVAKKI